MKNLRKLMLVRVSVILVSLLFIYACSKDDDGVQANDGFDGSYSSIEHLLSGPIMDSLINLGLEIHEGSMPPHIEGDYRLSPTILESSTVPSDLVGSEFNAANFSFADQDNSSLTITFDAEEDLGAVHEGSGSFISGNGDNFSVFLRAESLTNGYEGETIFIISGKKVAEGFTDFQLAFYMVDNGGNPFSIPNNSGRIFVDGDGLVDRL